MLIVWFVWVGVALVRTKETAAEEVEQPSEGLSGQSRMPSNNGFQPTPQPLDS
jgi:hypothetical protein